MHKPNPLSPVIKDLGLQHYAITHQAMLKHIEEARPCEVWILEHYPVYTLGKRSLPEHILKENGIEKVPTDRGGQVTYHGPGQMIIYPLLNIQAWKLSPIDLVSLLEDVTISTLGLLNIQSENDPNARGIYVNGEKIASIGLKIKQGYSYHGMAINLDMDLSPFNDIVPCGDDTMKMTQVIQHANIEQFKNQWIKILVEKLNATRYT